MSVQLAYFGVDDTGQLLWLGAHLGVDAAEAYAQIRGFSLRFLVDQPTAIMLLRRLQLFAGLEALPGLRWFAHFEWDGKLYLLEELGSATEAAALLHSCDHEPVALIDQSQMRVWISTLRKHVDLAML